MMENEKLLINQMKSFTDKECKTVSKFLLDKILEAYTQTEKQIKYKNTGYINLLELYNKNVDHLIYKHKIASKNKNS
jgi:phage FluMu protein Com